MKPPGRAVTQLRDGSYFDLLDPDPAKIELLDIARSLSRICRFNGRTTRHYSVLEHSLRVRTLGVMTQPRRTSALERALLLHDAAEAYTGDIIQPMKSALRLSGCTALKEIEHRLERAVEERFWLPSGIMADPCIKEADLLALEWERRNVIEPLGVLETPPEWPQPSKAGRLAVQLMEDTEKGPLPEKDMIALFCDCVKFTLL